MGVEDIEPVKENVVHGHPLEGASAFALADATLRKKGEVSGGIGEVGVLV